MRYGKLLYFGIAGVVLCAERTHQDGRGVGRRHDRSHSEQRASHSEQRRDDAAEQLPERTRALARASAEDSPSSHRSGCDFYHDPREALIRGAAAPPNDLFLSCEACGPRAREVSKAFSCTQNAAETGMPKHLQRLHREWCMTDIRRTACHDFVWCRGPSLCQRYSSTLSPLLQPVQQRAVVFVETFNSSRRKSPPAERWRYYSVLPCGKDVCLFYKDDVEETWVVGRRSRDGRTFSDAQLLMSKTSRMMTHNLAFASFENGTIIAVGGKARFWDRIKHNRPGAVYLTSIRAWCEEDACRESLASTASVKGYWTPPRHLFYDNHPGCYERAFADRDSPCAFDGRFSIVQFRNEWLLFARANVARGARFVQVTRSRDLVEWAPFQLLQLDGLQDVTTDKNINVYWWGVSNINDALLAVFPMVHAGRGCIALSCSVDGLHWSQPSALFACGTDVPPVHTDSHPAVGIVRRGELVDLYVHDHVAGIARMESSNFRPSLRRYSLGAQNLADWMRQSLACMAMSADTSGSARPVTRKRKQSLL